VLWVESKCPINPLKLTPALTTDSSTWSSYKDAVKILEECKQGKYPNGNQMLGIGFAWQLSNRIVGIDIDDCFDDDGNLFPIFKKIVLAFKDTYVEYSPSKKGLHIYAIANDDTPRIEKSWLYIDINGPKIKYKPLPKNKEDLVLRKGKGYENNEKTLDPYVHGVKVEMYSTGRYFTFTGDKVESASLEVSESNLNKLIKACNDELVGHRFQNNCAGETYDAGVVGDFGPFTRYDVLKIKSALESLPAHDEGIWYTEVTMPIARTAQENAEFHDDLYLIWDAWSATGSGYNLGENNARWERAKQSAHTTNIGHVYNLAKEGGWVAKKSYKDGDICYYANNYGNLDPIEIKDMGPEFADEVEEQTMDPWESITDATIESALSGSYIMDVLDALRCPMTAEDDVTPMPLSMVFGKAFALCGSIMSRKKKGVSDSELKNFSRHPSEHSMVRIISVSGMTTNFYSLHIAPASSGKDIGGIDGRLAGSNMISVGCMSLPGFYDVLEETENKIFRFSEMGLYLSDKDDYKSQVRSGLNDLFSGGRTESRYSKSGKTPNRELFCAFPSVIAHCQPQTFKTIARSSLNDNGFFRRFFCTCTLFEDGPNTYSPDNVDEKLVKKAQRAINHYHGIEGVVDFPRKPFKNLLKLFSESDNKRLEPIFRTYVHEYAPKIAVILQADGKPITRDTLERTEVIVLWAFAQTRQVMGELALDDKVAERNSKIDDVYLHIKKLFPKGITRTSLSKNCRTYRGLTKYEKVEVLETLDQSGIIREGIDGKIFAQPEPKKKINLTYQEKIFYPMRKPEYLGLPSPEDIKPIDIPIKGSNSFGEDSLFDGLSEINVEKIETDSNDNNDSGDDLLD